jgi:hypothetical protein
MNSLLYRKENNLYTIWKKRTIVPYIDMKRDKKLHGYNHAFSNVIIIVGPTAIYFQADFFKQVN